ncbi:MAG: hypothetical protein WCL32_08275 [Planctomycetota bacterium]|jgi:hypothetical protein
MARRRRPQKEKIVFSFDSFLDVVANVNGIIIRLILVAFVGARAYHSSMTMVEEPPADDVALASDMPAPNRDDDPLAALLDKQRRDLADLRTELASKASQTDGASTEAKAIDAQLAALAQMKEALSRQSVDLADAADKELRNVQTVAFSLEELARRGKALKKAIADVESIPPPKKELRYHTPVSKTVTSDEIFFECKNGRVTYLDLPGMMRDIEDGMKEKEELLRERFSVDAVTRPSGAFRVKYTIVRRRNMGEALGEADRPRERIFFGYGLGRFVVEPIAPIRGETLEQAMRAASEFRQSVDALDSQTVVTFWVYPDSFMIFRHLRDYLYEKGIEVAGRPLPENEPISGSPTGSRSRGQ